MALTKKKIHYLRNKLFLPVSYQTSIPVAQKKITVCQLIFFLLKGSKISFACVTLAYMFGTFIDWVYGSAFSKWVVMIVENSNSDKATVLHQLIVAFVTMSLIWGIGDVVSRITGFYFARVLIPKFDAKIKISFLERITRNSYEYFTKNSTGYVMSSFHKILFSIKCFLTKFCKQLAPNIMTIALLMGSLFFVHWSIFLVIFIHAVLYTAIFVLSYKKIYFFQRKAMDAFGRTTSAITDVIMNYSSVLFFSRKKYEIERTKKIQNYESKRIEISGTFLETLKTIRVTIGFLLCTVTFYAIIYVLYKKQLITASDIVYASSINGACYALLCMLQEEISDIISDFGSMQQGLDIINECKIAHTIAGGTDLNVKEGEIKIDNVSFAYNDNKIIFNDLNLTIKPHQKIGLVGHSGAGKTTLVNMILRNLFPKDGKISIDGQNIAFISDNSLKQNISVVSQDTTLFNRSVIDNIRYSKPEATFEEVADAAKKANAHDFIKDLENGYSTNVGERGIKLSGGQRQRIIIARAILKDAPILILDEATSALDAENEEIIQQSLQALMENKTVIAIAHKLNTLRKMDKIVVMQEGEIVEQGSHEELINKENGSYKTLWDIQKAAITMMDE